LNQTPTSTTLGALGARLRELREQAGLTGAELATVLGAGWRQPKISKIENGRQLPTEAELIAWAKATRTEAAPLIALRGKAAVEYGTHRDRIARASGAVAHQQDLTRLAESCTFLAEFQPALVPGRLQTAAYMREKSLRDPTIADDGIAWTSPSPAPTQPRSVENWLPGCRLPDRLLGRLLPVPRLS
jgi:transcriptional regulator with XRE-family HTH domain